MPGLDSFKIGTYQLGYRWVDLFADPEEMGGNFFFMPDDTYSHSRIRVGFRYECIDDCWCVLFHEAMEAIITEMECRYKPTSCYISGASDIYRFYFDHNQFTEIAARLAMFIKACIKDFEAAFDLIQEEKKNG